MADIEDRIIRIEDKIDGIKEEITNTRISQEKHNAVLAAQHESLKSHMHRTELLEEAIVPLKKHEAMLLGAAKLILFAVTVLGAGESISIILNYIKH